jgi:hypothetical protein
VPMPSEAPRLRALPAAIVDRRQTATDVYELRPRTPARTHPRTHTMKDQAPGAQGFRLHARTNISTCARTQRHNEPSSSVRSESKGATRERDGFIKHQGRNPDLRESNYIDELLCVCSWWAAIKAFATQDEVKQAVMSDPKHVHLLVFVAPGWCHWSQKQLQELQANFGVCRFACAVPCTQCRPYVHYLGTS